jgi:hypothetical protein
VAPFSSSRPIALSLLSCLLFAHSLGYTEIEAESDSLEVVNICSGQEHMWNDSTAVYAKIVTCAGAIGKVEFNHCARDFNMVAHILARECSISKASCNWVDEPPDFILAR